MFEATPVVRVVSEQILLKSFEPLDRDERIEDLRGLVERRERTLILDLVSGEITTVGGACFALPVAPPETVTSNDSIVSV